MLNSKGTEFFKAFRRFRANCIFKENASGKDRIHRKIKICAVFFRKSDSEMLKKFFASACNGRSVYFRGYSLARNFGSLICGGNFDSRFLCFCYNAFCNGVVGKCFRGRGKTKNFFFGKTARGTDFFNVEISGSEGSGFIENRIFNFRKLFAIFGTFYDDSVLGSGTDSRKICKRNR